jgi:transcription elongation factor Elf1
MDLENPPEIAGIAITCPHCGRVETDDFEVLNLDEVHAITCDGCKQRFHLVIAECSRCGDETVLTWPTIPTPAQIRQASCARCGSRLIEHDDDSHTMGAGR